MDAYATVDQYRRRFNKTQAANIDLESLLASASDLIDRELDRSFSKDAEPVTRTYEFGRLAQGCQLWIDDMAEAPSEVIVSNGGSFDDATALDSDDYRLEPMNAAYGRNPEPWYSILFPATRGYYGELARVTTRWGWPAVPPAITQATLELAGLIVAEGPRATREISVGTTRIIQVSRAAQDVIHRLYDSYRKPVLAAI